MKKTRKQYKRSPGFIGRYVRLLQAQHDIQQPNQPKHQTKSLMQGLQTRHRNQCIKAFVITVVTKEVNFRKQLESLRLVSFESTTH